METDVEGYRVYWGTSSKNYQYFKDIGNTTSTDVLVSPGSWYFACTAYNDFGESSFSNEVHFP